jgi:hypothetical protein
MITMSKIRSGARKNRNEDGMTAIFVTMIMIFVISILVIGFALLSRREQRQSLDTQLSTQAYYAAESGVNDAIAAIRAQQSTSSGTITPTGGCADSGPYKFNSSVPKSSELSAPDKVSYSCVIIDPAPKQLDFKNVGSDGVVVPLTSDRGGANPKFQSITLTWQPIAGREANATTGCAANTTLPPNTSAAWTCGFPMLRVETVPTETLGRASLLSGTRVKFLKPVTGGGGNSVSINNNATVEMVRCTNVCTMTFNTGGASSKYYMRVAALYGQTPRVSVSATDAAGAVGLSGAQAIIDVTGKAQGVMRRVVVAVDLTDANAGKAPNAAITSGESICKRFAVGPNYFRNEANATAGSYNSTYNTLCKP